MVDRRPSTKAEQRTLTTARLLRIARSQFAEHGYAHASTEHIVHLAGVTRGALYHYFDNKAGLFRAVVAELQHEVAQRIAEATSTTPDPWEQLLIGCRAFLRASLDHEVQQILLIDGPAVLGWDAWRKLDADHAMRLLEAGIRQLADAGEIVVSSIAAMTHVLSGAMNEAVLWIAQATEPQTALDEAIAVLEHLLSGIRQR
jgi:AcrR family transcriptional regulator